MKSTKVQNPRGRGKYHTCGLGYVYALKSSQCSAEPFGTALLLSGGRKHGNRQTD